MKRFALALVALALAGCAATSAPTPTPGGYENFIAGLVLRGATITGQVAGDAGCPGVALHKNAARFDVTFENEPGEYTIYFFAWRRASDYESSAAEFADCVASAQAMNSAMDYTSFVASPLRVYGGDWPQPLATAIEISLIEASGQ